MMSLFESVDFWTFALRARQLSRDLCQLHDLTGILA